MRITEQQRQFLDEIGELAAADMRESGLLASLTLAWAILESDWGTSRLAANSWAEHIAERSKLLGNLPRYRAVVGERDYKAACAALQAAENSSDPNYAEKLVYLIETYRLTDYDSMGGEAEEIPEQAPQEEVMEAAAEEEQDAPEEAAEEEQEAPEEEQDAPQAAAEEIPAETPEEAPEEAAEEEQEAPEEKQDAPQAAAEEIPAETPEEAPEEAAEEIPAETPEEEAAEEAAEETAEEAQSAEETPAVPPFSENVRIPMPYAEFIARLQDIVDHYKTLYVMGCFGAPLTGDNVNYYLSNHTYNKQRQRVALIRAAANQKPPVYGFDCVCLIKGVLWGWSGDPSHKFGGAKYASNGVPDLGADAMITQCRNLSSDFSSIVPGEAVWMSGHIGVYIGNGLVIESSPAFNNRVQITECRNVQRTSGINGRKWTRHGKLPYIDYSAPPMAADTTQNAANPAQSANVQNFSTQTPKTDSTTTGIVPGVRVRYSGVLYGKSDGSDPGKPVSGEFTVKYYYSNKKCGVCLANMGWVPASACTVVK